MSSTRGRLDQSCVDVAEVVDLEDLGLRVGAVLGEPAREVDAMPSPLGNAMSIPALWGSSWTREVCTHVLTEKTLAASAVEAMVAQLRVVCCDAVTDLKAHHPGADSSHDADSFVAWDKGKLGDEFAFVDVLSVPR